MVHVWFKLNYEAYKYLGPFKLINVSTFFSQLVFECCMYTQKFSPVKLLLVSFILNGENNCPGTGWWLTFRLAIQIGGRERCGGPPLNLLLLS